MLEFRGRIPALDGLRGIAILLVMLYHFTTSYIHSFGGVFYQVSNVGWCGVDLFFVLSGFLITGILCDAKSAQHYFQNFYMRRVLRIFPLYYGFLFALFVLLPLVHEFSPFIRHHISEQIWLWCYLTNFECSYFPAFTNQLRLGHFWSLAVEEQFYLIWPAVVFWCRSETAVRISSICIGAALAFRLLLVMDHTSPLTIYFLIPCRMDSLATGALCALLVRSDFNPGRLLRRARLITVVSGAELVYILCWRANSNWDNPVMQSVGFSLLAFFFGGLILLALDTSKRNFLPWILSCPLLVLFGFYSYALYVFHFPLVRVFDRWFSVNRLSVDLHSRSLGLGAHVLCSSLVLLFVAVLSWHLFEKHFMKMKSHFVLTSRVNVANQGGFQQSQVAHFFGFFQRWAEVLRLWAAQCPF